MVRAENNDTVS